MAPSVVVSIVVVNYRSYAELTSCLAAILVAARGIATQIIVVDQASIPDHAATIQGQFPVVTMLPNTGNDGFAAGVNRGAALARGRYVLLVNPDTIVSQDLIQVLAAWLDAYADVGVVGPRIFNTDRTIQPSARRFPDVTTGLGGRMSWLTQVAPDNWLSRRNLGPSLGSAPVGVDWVSGACMMIRKSAFQAVGGMDERFFLYWEDADLCRRLLSKGYRTFYLPVTSAVHEGASGSVHAAARSLVAFHRSALRYYWKHGSVFQRALAPLVMLALSARLLMKLALLCRFRSTARTASLY